MIQLKHIMLSLLLFLIFKLHGGTPFEEGIKQYQNKAYAMAIQSFESEITERPNNSAAFFNLGLAYHAEKKFGKAIWAYEKVLKLQPNDAEAIENIDLNNAELDPSGEWSPILNRFQRSMYSLSSNTWSLLVIISCALSAISLILFKKSGALSTKRFFLILFISGLGIVAFSLINASGAYKHEHISTYAIVTKPSIDTYSDGSVISKDVTGIQLKEGTRVERISFLKGPKVEIRTNTGEKYYVLSSDIDMI